MGSGLVVNIRLGSKSFQETNGPAYFGGSEKKFYNIDRW